jgi:CubicO group peptidase (beta-lactamase class C family)
MTLDGFNVWSPIAIVLIALLAGVGANASPEPSPAVEVVGLWQAERNFGPEVQGTLEVFDRSGVWSAEIAGHAASVVLEDDAITFEIANDRGAFRGRLRPEIGDIVGHWIQPPAVANRVRFATPVTLARHGSGHWRGEVTPLADRMTFFLSLGRTRDGSVGGFLRNPEANFGQYFHIARVLRDGDHLRFVESDGRVRLEGPYYPDVDAFSLFIPDAGGTFDFLRVTDDPSAPFHPRAVGSEPYVYRPPAPRDDGWPVGSLEEMGMAVSPIEDMVRMIVDTPMDTISAPYIHAVLIARHGTLVVEEYFHGHTADTPHDTRSASKTVTSTLIGLAIHAGEPVNLSSPVYPIMYDDDLPPDLDPRKRRIILEHLLTMSPGLACDDNDSDSPGAEWRMQSQTAQPDWLRYTLELPILHEPGEVVTYCSASSNLAGGVLSRAAGSWLPTMYQTYFAEPLEVGVYHMNLMPSGDAYGGGGLHITARDFLKMGQLFLDDGQWNGRRLLGEEWVRDAVTPAHRMFEQGYGYAWWITEFPYQHRTVTAFYAGGNGGQYVMGIPELDLAIVFFGGNYNQATTHLIKKEHVPNYILPSVAAGESSASIEAP